MALDDVRTEFEGNPLIAKAAQEHVRGELVPIAQPQNDRQALEGAFHPPRPPGGQYTQSRVVFDRLVRDTTHRPDDGRVRTPQTIRAADGHTTACQHSGRPEEADKKSR